MSCLLHRRVLGVVLVILAALRIESLALSLGKARVQLTGML